MNKAAIHIPMLKNQPSKYPESRLLDYINKTILNFMRKCQTVFQNVYTILQPTSNELVAITLHLCRQLILSVFPILTSLIDVY